MPKDFFFLTHKTPAQYQQREFLILFWANFLVTFPPGKDAISWFLRSPGYDRSGLDYSTYTYIIYIGAGWKDSIGSAEIIFRLPMQASEETVHFYNPTADHLKEPNLADLSRSRNPFPF